MAGINHLRSCIQHFLPAAVGVFHIGHEHCAIMCAEWKQKTGCSIAAEGIPVIQNDREMIHAVARRGQNSALNSDFSQQLIVICGDQDVSVPQREGRKGQRLVRIEPHFNSRQNLDRRIDVAAPVGFVIHPR